ncbi:LytTR family DNA-binding domain-containing protein [Planktotalea sp.]|uniref:LytTR family DNA-binding domain-containing protein n=1 Tax=Planktotalea sp. TaxID=2029877 RepID=UPI003D6C463A
MNLIQTILSRPPTLKPSEVEIVTMRGRILRFSEVEMRHALLNPHFCLYLFLAALLYFWADIHGLSFYLETPLLFLFWQFAAVVTVVFYVAFVYSWGQVSKRYGWIRPFLPAVPLVTIWPTLLISRIVLISISDAPFPSFEDHVRAWMVTMVGVWVFELLYVEFVQPVVEARYSRLSVDREKKKVPFVVLASNAYPIDMLNFVKSADHYLEVNLLTGSSETVYGKLSEVLLQTQPEWGISPHRSYWVSKNAISGLKNDGRKMFLALRNGDEVRVAEAKKKEVKDWLLDQRPELLKSR